MSFSILVHSKSLLAFAYFSFNYLSYLRLYSIMLWINAQQCWWLICWKFQGPNLYGYARLYCFSSNCVCLPCYCWSRLANLIQIIPKRNPNKDTSLVDYNLVKILIPSCIYGSTLGVIIVQFIPQLVQDVFLMIILSFFTYYFMRKYYKSQQKLTQNIQMQLQNQNKMFQMTTLDKQILEKRILQEPQSNRESFRESIMKQKFLIQSMMRESIQKQHNQIKEQNKIQLQKIEEYQRGNHTNDIIFSIVIVICFELLALIAQGKLFLSFNQCQPIYYMSLGLFTLFYILYIYIIRVRLKKKVLFYKKVGYQYGIQLEKGKVFLIIFCGGFAGGFIQGIIGVGTGHCMVASMVLIGVNQKTASATSSFQIFFIGIVTTIEAIASDRLTIIQAVWFIGIAFFIGGSLTLLCYRYIANKPSRVNLVIIAIISIISVLGTIPSIILTQKYQGWGQLIDIALSKCN